MKKILILFLFPTFLSFSQDLKLSSLLIPSELSENANSVIRDQIVEIEILSQESMIIKKSKIITVLNSKGLNNVDAVEYYNNSTKVKVIEATIYNSFGYELKKIKRKDFRDQSVADGFSIYSDKRRLFLEYTPTEYPFTIVYNSEIETSNTAFIPSWYPIDDYYESVQNSKIKIKFLPELGFKYKEINFNDGKIKKEINNNQMSYMVENLSALKYEELSPVFINNNPSVLFGLDSFNFEGVKGNAKNWKDFGSWVYDKLLVGTETIPESTIQKVKSLVGDEKDPIEKAKIVYKFLQDRSRYVSIQLGIGGWKPMIASDVDRLGYGDCKALTNYARVLLYHVGVESFYTILYAGNNKENIIDDFVSMQGNHAILSIPFKNDYISLECTSQTSPFGFNGDFTDDRYALIIKPSGGELIKTNEYNQQKSKQIIKGEYSLNEKGDLIANFKRISTGVQYDQKYLIKNKSQNEKESYYKEQFEWLQNLKIHSTILKDDKDKIEFIEDLSFSASNYSSNNGSMLLAINALNRATYVPQRYRNRNNSFEIERGYLDEDEIEINLPRGYVIDAKPNDILINNKFGIYTMELKIISPTRLLYKRSYLLNKGYYQKDEYENFRSFSEQVSKADNAKIILKRITNN